MYLVGAPHRNRDLLEEFLRQHASDDYVRARRIAHDQQAIAARDCLHLAVMERRGVAAALTFDAGFSLRPGIVRVP